MWERQMDLQRKPLFIINSVAPIRICDNGGWTDTWFAGHGRIFNIGVYPYAEVQVAVYADGDPQSRDRDQRRELRRTVCGQTRRSTGINTRLLEAAIEYMRVPKISPLR